jgi:hypothetical protein
MSVFSASHSRINPCATAGKRVGGFEIVTQFVDTEINYFRIYIVYESYFLYQTLSLIPNTGLHRRVRPVRDPRAVHVGREGRADGLARLPRPAPPVRLP